MKDPRYAQITVLTALATWGFVFLDFGFEPTQVAVTLGTALCVQAVGNATRGERFDPRSALISGLSLVLLLRSVDLGACFLAASIAVGSKFVLRLDGRHVFNPTNIALVTLLIATDSVWISSGQWGSGPIAVASCVAAALWVLPRVRGDVTIAFMSIWTGLLFGRALWLGDPIAIPLHQLSSGTLFVFAAFMLSDPRTIPNSRLGRIVFATIVALLGYVGRFEFYEPNALLYSLALSALLVPLLDQWLPGEVFLWPGQWKAAQAMRPRKETKDASQDDLDRVGDPADEDKVQPGLEPARGMRSHPVCAGHRGRLLRVLRRQGGYEALQ